MSQLPTPALDCAIDYILANGTELQRSRFSYHFGDGSGEAVLNNLTEYRNDDGGFGHGLESDLRTPHSSVVATTIALQIMQEINVSPDSVLLQDALSYLLRQHNRGNWSLIGPECNDAPHAPWWQYREDNQPATEFRANPGAEILGYLINYPNAMCTARVQQLTRRAIEHVSAGSLEMHELLCYQRCYELAPSELQMQLMPHLLRCGFELVKVDPLDWEEYCLTPLDVVQHPDSLFADFFSDYLDLNFEFLSGQQTSDGSWHPRWSWGGEFPATWQVVEPEICAELTLKTLLTYKAFDRL